MSWKQIHTIPSGQKVLVYDERECEILIASKDNEDKWHDEYGFALDHDEYIFTHWQELPDRPRRRKK